MLGVALAALAPSVSALDCDVFLLEVECVAADFERPNPTDQPLAELDPEISSAIQSLTWAKTSVSEVEQRAIYRLENIARLSPDLFWYLVRDLELPRYDGNVESPMYSFRYQVSSDTLKTLDLYVRIAALPWVQDGLDEWEALAPRILYGSAAISPAYTEALLNRKWIRDGVSRIETAVIDRLYNTLRSLLLYPGNPQAIGEIMTAFVAMPFMDEINGIEPRAVNSVTLVYSRNLSALQRIVEYITSKGGITDDNVYTLVLHGGNQAFIDSIPDINDPELFDQYLAPASSRGIVIEEREISLPLAGPVLLTVVRDGPASLQTMDILESSVRMVENAMGEAYPTDFVFLEIVGAHTSSNYPSIRHQVDEFRNESVSDRTKSTVIHELGHHYWSNVVTWIGEGGATFLELRTGHEDAGYLDRIGDGCPDWIMRNDDRESLREVCPYYFGGSLFWDLYQALGDDAFHESFRRLYRMIEMVTSDYQNATRGNIWIDDRLSDDYCLYCGDVEPALYHVRLAFVGEADPESGAIADEVISRWYFGEEP